MIFICFIALCALSVYSIIVINRNFNLRMSRALHLLQLEDYEPIRMLKAQIKQINTVKTIGLELKSALISIGVFVLIVSTTNKIDLIRGNFTLVVTVVLSSVGYIFWTIGVSRDSKVIRSDLNQAKKQLAMTDRAKRINFVAKLTGIVFLVIYFTVGYIYFLLMYDKMAHPPRNVMSSPHHEFLPIVWNMYWALYILVGIFTIVPLTAYIFSRSVAAFLSISVTVLRPHELLTQFRFMRDAKSILIEFNPLVVGITGSYGKTSVKEILAVLLSGKYNVLKPPGSYNTLMGVTRVIREQLRHYHDVFIVEMGAYREGSIQKLCRLTEPTHGLITIIGLQHLERFKTQRSIQRAKGELIRALPSEGIAILNADDPLSCEIGADYATKSVYFSMTGGQEGRDTVFVSNIELSVHGSKFDVNFPDGMVASISLPLLGRAAIINAVAAIAMADSLGVERNHMKMALTDIPQVRHRLEAIHREDGVNIIDDAFNSNPIGAAIALEVLSKATSGKRILITPGMVELGEEEEKANQEFGRLAAESCDIAILVGDQRVKPIENGLVGAGFAGDKIWIVSSFKAGMKRLDLELKSGDTVLIENDLPDQYDNL